MALFWHGVFATGVSKVDHWDEITDLVDMLRESGMGSYRDILLKVAQNPAMIYWLDNNENHAHAVNENWGRELLELFSMGVGNYTEDDVLECSRAFTGWTITPKLPRFPMGRFDWFFEYKDEDHDDGEKTFLGQKGKFNGEDIIDIIVKQPATAQFISRHLYNFFVADEPQVPAWSITPPQDQEAIDELVETFMESEGDMTQVMRTLLNADWFKNARFRKIKSPSEFVAGAIVLSGTPEVPEPTIAGLNTATTVMGQSLMNPPTVEGWHTGKEWLDSGTLTERVNFAVNQVSDIDQPGIRSIISRIEMSDVRTPGALVNSCLELTGNLSVSSDTHEALLELATQIGTLTFDDDDARKESSEKISRLLQLIVSAPEYQFA